MLVYCGQYKGKCIIKDTDDGALEFFTKLELKKIIKTIPDLRIVGCGLKNNALSLEPKPDYAFKSPPAYMTVKDGVIKAISLSDFNLLKEEVRLSDYGWKFDPCVKNSYKSGVTYTTETLILHFDDNIVLEFNNEIADLFRPHMPIVRYETSNISDPNFLHKLVVLGARGNLDLIIDSKRNSDLGYYNFVALLKNLEVDITSYKTIQSMTKPGDANRIYDEFKDLLIASMKNSIYKDYVTRDVKLAACLNRSVLSFDTLDTLYRYGDCFFANYAKVYGDMIPLELKHFYIDRFIVYMQEHLLYPDRQILDNGFNASGLLNYKSSLGVGQQTKVEMLNGVRLEVDGDVLRAIVFTSLSSNKCSIILSKYCKHIVRDVIRYEGGRVEFSKDLKTFVLDDNLDVTKDAFYRFFYDSNIMIDVTNYNDTTVINYLYSKLFTYARIIDSDERFYKVYVVKYLVSPVNKNMVRDLSVHQKELIQKYIIKNESRLIKHLNNLLNSVVTNTLTICNIDRFSKTKKYYVTSASDVGINFGRDSKLILYVKVSKGIFICMNAFHYFKCSQEFKNLYIKVMQAVYKYLCEISDLSYN